MFRTFREKMCRGPIARDKLRMGNGQDPFNPNTFHNSSSQVLHTAPVSLTPSGAAKGWERWEQGVSTGGGWLSCCLAGPFSRKSMHLPPRHCWPSRRTSRCGPAISHGVVVRYVGGTRRKRIGAGGASTRAPASTARKQMAHGLKLRCPHDRTIGKLNGAHLHQKGNVMSSESYGRGSGFGNSWRRSPWPLPLVLGIGIGALLFQLPFGMWRWGHGGRSAFERHPAVHGYSRGGEQVAPPAGARQGDSGAQVAPQAAQGHFKHGQGPAARQAGYAREGRHHSFFPFFPLLDPRLILPLLLIGLGAWLLSGGRRGPGNWGGRPGPQQIAAPPAPAATPVEPKSDDDREPPSTGQTQRL